MGFRDRLEAQRNDRADIARARAEAAESEAASKKQAARAAAKALLPEVYEAIGVLRENAEQSEASLARMRDSHRGSWGIGAIVAARREPPQEWHLFRRPSTRRWREFAGWWVRREPFEFELPLEGNARVGIFQTMNWLVGPKHTLEQFVEQAIYEYRVASRNEGGPSEVRQASAETGLRDFLETVMEHLVDLPG